MRKGQNPAKSVKDVVQPARITVAVVNYIPFLSGFYAESLDVLKASLTSLRQDPGLPYDLMVFDNGSCEEVQDYLIGERRLGNIQYLLLSKENLGKGGAWNIIFGGVPGEIIAYSDSDIYYYPGWLAETVKILETFPNAGMVTSRPFWTPEKLYTATTDWAAATPEVVSEFDKFLSWEEFSSFLISLGNSEEEAREQFQRSELLRFTYQGVQAIAGSTHWQFVAKKSTLLRYVPFSMTRPMGQVRQLDERVNEDGFLRLMTARPYVQNMSNTLPDYARAQAAAPQQQPRQASLKKKIFNLPVVKTGLLRLYDQIFDIYYR